MIETIGEVSGGDFRIISPGGILHDPGPCGMPRVGCGSGKSCNGAEGASYGRDHRGLGRHIPVGCGNDSDINGDGFCPAHTFDLLILKHAEESNLGLRRQFANFIKKDRSGVGSFEAPRLLADASGKCAFFMPEKLAIRLYLYQAGQQLFPYGHHALLPFDKLCRSVL